MSVTDDLRLQEAKFYVYLLIDPRDGETFYVGKGTGTRMYQHETDAARGVVTNPVKAQRILSILDDGRHVHYQVDSWWDDERVAFARERELIQSIQGLTNIAPGQLGWVEQTWECPDGSTVTSRYSQRDVLEAQLALDQLKRVNPEPRQDSLYQRVVQEYQKIAAGLAPTEVTITFPVGV